MRISLSVLFLFALSFASEQFYFSKPIVNALGQSTQLSEYLQNKLWPQVKDMGSDNVQLTGQYFQVENNYQIMINVVDASNTEVIKTKVFQIPKTDSLVKLDRAWLSKVSTFESKEVLEDQYLSFHGISGDPKKVYSGCRLQGFIQFPKRGEIKFFPEETIVIDTKGQRSKIWNIYLSGQRNQHQIIPDTKLALDFKLYNFVEQISYIEVPYEINGKRYLYKKKGLVF